MEGSMVYKKKIKIYTGIAMVINYLLYLAKDFIPVQFMSTDLNANQSEVYASKAWSGILAFATSLIAFAMFFFIGKALTKNNQKAAIFTASAYFSLSAASIFSVFVRELATICMHTSLNLSSNLYAYIIIASKALCVPISTILAYITFTTLEGINEKLCSKDIGGFETTPGQAKKNYIIYFVLSVVCSFVFGSGLLLLMSLFETMDFTVPFKLRLSLSGLSELLGNSLPVVILYYIGYKSKKSHREAMAFSVSHYFANTVIALIFTMPVSAVTGYITNTIRAESLTTGEYQRYTAASSILGVISIVLSVVATVVSFIIVFRLLDKFFAKADSAIPEEIDGASAVEVAIEDAASEEDSTVEVSAEEVSVQETVE